MKRVKWIASLALCVLAIGPIGAIAAVYDLGADVAANGGWSSTSPTAATWSAGSSQTLGGFTAYDEYLGGPTVWDTKAYLSQAFNDANANAGHITPHSYYPGDAVYMAADNTWDGSTYTVYSIIRWTSPEAGSATIDAALTGGTSVVDAWVLKNGSVLASGATSGTLGTTVAVGDTIDLVIKRVAGADGAHNAIVAVDAAISVVPEPLTLGLLAIGAAGFIRRKA